MGKDGKRRNDNFNIVFDRLSEDYEDSLKRFYCGNDTLDEYFHEYAMTDKIATNYLFMNEDNSDIITMFTISCSGIPIIDKNDDSYRDVVSAIEINNFATDNTYQGILFSKDENIVSLSHRLLLTCIDFISDVACNICGASKIVLYSIPTKVGFYTRGGFEYYEKYMEEKNIPYLDDCVPMYLNLI